MVSIAPPSPTTAEAASFAPMARLVGVSKRYGSVAALQDVSIDVARGRVLGIIGRGQSELRDHLRA
jgi:ABC-type phosphonate transport system ATPase subunit